MQLLLKGCLPIFLLAAWYSKDSVAQFLGEINLGTLLGKKKKKEAKFKGTEAPWESVCKECSLQDGCEQTSLKNDVGLLDLFQ